MNWEGTNWDLVGIIWVLFGKLASKVSIGIKWNLWDQLVC